MRPSFVRNLAVFGGIAAMAVGTPLALAQSAGLASADTSETEAVEIINASGNRDAPIADSSDREPGGKVVRPFSAGRIVRFFGFNQRLPTPLPIEDWYRGQSAPELERERPGFPVWNGALLDLAAPSFEGDGSVRLPTTGGSTSVKLRQGVLPVFESADYLVTASIRTEGLSHAAAVLDVWQIDQAGREIEGSRVRSEPMRTNGRWREVGVEILSQDEDAAFLQMEMLLLQPRELAGLATEPAAFQIWQEDYEGAAWFDAVAVRQLPRVEVRTGEPGEIVLADRVPELDIFIRDLAGESLELELRVTDAWGRVVDRRVDAFSGGRYRDRWSPSVTERGWYRATVRLRSPSQGIVGGARCDFVWLGPDRAGVSDLTAGMGPRYGLGFASSMPALLEQLPGLSRRVGAHAVALPIWDADSPDPKLRPAGLAASLQRLLEQDLELTLGFARLPRAIAERTGLRPEEVFGAFDQPGSWTTIEEPMLDRFGQRIRRWSLGTPGPRGDDDPSPAKVERVRTALARLVPGPIVTLPLTTEQAWEPSTYREGVGFDLRLEPGLDGEALNSLADRWREMLRLHVERSRDATGGVVLSADPPELTLTIEPLDEELFGAAASAADVVRRAVSAASAFRGIGAASSADRAAGRIGRVPELRLQDPVETVPGRRPRVYPRATLAAWAELARRTEGRRFIAELELLPGVRCMVLESIDPRGRSASGALILWREDARAAEPVLTSFLGSDVVQVFDLFGNERPVEGHAVGSGHATDAVLAITRDPMYVEGIDPEIVTMLASVRLEPGLIESRNAVLQHELVLDNPWGQPVRGRAFLLEPGGFTEPGSADRRWVITPRVFEFSMPANGQARVPLTIELAAGVPGGMQPLVVDLDFEGFRGMDLVRVRRTVELGLRELTMLVRPRLNGNDGSVYLDAEVTNLGSRVLNLDLAAVAPGQPRGNATINGLKPGETVIRSFAFAGALDELRGSDVAVSLVESGGGDFRLIKATTIE